MKASTLSRFALVGCLVLVSGASTVLAQPGNRPNRGEGRDAMKFGEEGTEKEYMPVHKLEEHLGKELSDEQKEQLGVAAKTIKAGVKAVEGDYVATVSSITGLEEKQIIRLDPPLMLQTQKRRHGAKIEARVTAAFTKRLNTVLEKPLTGSQERQIERAYEDRQKDIEPLREDLTRAIAKITGISTTKVRSLIKPAG